MSSLFGPLWLNFAGVSNPLWLVGCVLLLRHKLRPARICLVLAVFLALQTFQLRFQPMSFDGGETALGFLIHPLIGWYAWFSALLLPLLSCLRPVTPSPMRGQIATPRNIRT